MKIISIDTETKIDRIKCEPVPFVATSTNTYLKSRLYELPVEKDFQDLKTISTDPTITKVFHNATYDIYVSSNVGINCVPPYEDTMIMATLVNENFDSKKLKVLAKVHLNEPCLEAEELNKIKAKYKRELKKSLAIIGDDLTESEIDDFDYSMIPSEILYPYAIKDAVYTLKLYFLFRKIVYERYKELYEFELSLIPIVVEMTKNGFNIDRPFVKSMIDEYTKESDEVFCEMLSYLNTNGIDFTKTTIRKSERGLLSFVDKITQDKITNIEIEINDVGKEIYFIEYAEEFNPNAAAHLRKAILGLGIIITKVTEKKQEVATDKEALLSIPKNSPGYKFIELLLRWRFLSKQLSTYYIPLYTKYTNDYNSIAHFIFYQSGAKSGRFTAQLVQTIPRTDEVDDERFVRHIRRAFIPKQGKVLVAIDYDQIEMRIFADFSECQKLIDDINSGYDPHTGTAWTLFGKDYYESCSKEKKKALRRMAKTINFGIIYGMGKNKLANSLGVPLKEAYDILDTYHKNYPVKEHIRHLTGVLYKKGFVSIEANSSLMKFKRDYHVPQELAYRAVNIRIQGMAAYCMKYGIKRSTDWIKQHKLNIPLICTIHDELFFEIDEQDYDVSLVYHLQNQMEDRVTFAVPILASPKVSNKSWGDAKEI